jgi:hypothetical protein
MELLTLSKPCEAEPTVVRDAYRWFFLDVIQPAAEDAQELYDFSSTIEPQIDLFPQQTCIDVRALFRYLVGAWRMQRGTTSSTTEMVICPAYQSIIGLGPVAVGLILAELASEGDDPDHWFWALQILTRENPVSEEDEGNLARMARAWLDWGASQGYAW